MCRKALELHNQDLAKAEKWLRAEAIKQGWEKAERVKSRNTGEGLVGIYTAPDRTHATMVEVKCETDFVAKNENFIELVTKLAERLSQQTMHQSADIRDTTVSINKLWIVDEKKLNEISGQIITETISKLGENIRFVRGCIIRIQKSENQSDNTPVLLPYTHSVAGKIDSKDSNVILGKYGTIIAIQKKQSSVEVKPSSSTEEDMIGVVSSSSIEEVGSKLGQHIIGLSPLSILPPDSAESADIENVNGDEEPTALMKQKFIFNDEITVEQFLNNSQANILDFVRFECGEELQSN
ncbi:hypothetical protein RDWZM_006119 [Blomia tropicalis]|uniref:Elongation factor Ts, mitochondrial n=1 Tax=Blomia tropicalis TaxID=40697 RepID=A0A9Q0M9S3_BLOTA|nr:hypothetical protein RDWZM_006119 [Blomia tropicalis]